MRIRLAIPDHLVTPEALEAALEATTLANQTAIEQGEVPLATEAIDGGVKWREEGFADGEHFDLAHTVEQRRWGDCDDLAPWLTAELRATGDDHGARTRIIRTGPQRWHAVTETSDGEILDPSKWAGMGRRSSRNSGGVHGTLARPFAHVGGGAIACLPGPRGWYARCDVPFGDAHLASHARARTADLAVAKAVSGALVCGEGSDCPLIYRAHAAGQFLLNDAASVSGPMDKILGLRKQWETEMIAKGYSKDRLPPKTGPDSWIEWGQARGLQKGNATSFGSALKGAARIVAPAAGVAIPGASTLSALSQGMGLPRPFAPEGGAIVRAPNGAISVPLESPDSMPEHGQHMFLMYHPLGNPGPVVMRF